MKNRPGATGPEKRQDLPPVLAGAHVAEEVGQHGGALLRAYAVYNLNLMVELLHLKEIQNRTGAAGLGVRGADDNAVDTGLHQGAGTHLARLERHIHRAPFEAPVAELTAGLTNRDNLRMGERGVRREAAVEAPPDDASVADDDAADGDLAEFHGASGLMKSFLHVKSMVVGMVEHIIESAPSCQDVLFLSIALRGGNV